MKVRLGPQQNRACVCTMSEEESLRVNRFIAKIGSIKDATARLGIGGSTMDSARACGRMQRTTRDKLLAALTEQEALP